MCRTLLCVAVRLLAWGLGPRTLMFHCWQPALAHSVFPFRRGDRERPVCKWEIDRGEGGGKNVRGRDRWIVRVMWVRCSSYTFCWLSDRRLTDDLRGQLLSGGWDRLDRLVVDLLPMRGRRPKWKSDMGN
ncbi:hypothetical protein N431DRAFT_132986 [Stipitochalara longipes BDJ]|nr:hypothetical protein N431DRAFT_132986 [Stipitochalara longipes BDJ]